MQEFLTLRGINLKGLKQVLQDKALEIVVVDDYKTICDLQKTQLGYKKDEPVLFSRPADNVNATSTQTKAIQKNPEATQTKTIQNNPQVNKIVNTVSKQNNLEECILIKENQMEDDKTGLFYIKNKIYTLTTIAQMCSRYSFILTDAQYLEMSDSRHNVDELLKYNVQLQLRFFINNNEAVSQSAKLWLNGTEIRFAVRSYIY